MSVQRLEDLMRQVFNDHGGDGYLHAYRAYDCTRQASGVAFIDLVVVPPGSSIGLHQHGDDVETYIILRGTGSMIIDGETFPVRTGDVVPNHSYGHHGLANDGDEDLHLLVFEISPAPGRSVE